MINVPDDCHPAGLRDRDEAENQTSTNNEEIGTTESYSGVSMDQVQK